MSDRFEIISPVDGSVYTGRDFASEKQAEQAVEKAAAAQREWANYSLEQRTEILREAVDRFVAERDSIAEELAWLIGRPIQQGGGEVGGFEERARYMIDVASAALAPIDPGPKAGFERHIERVPLGVVLVISPWNFPYMTAVNSIWPALLAGNTVILKQASQTAPCADRLVRILEAAGLPNGVFQALDLKHATAARIMQTDAVRHICFTGSVRGGQAVQAAIANGGRFASAGLELGGKDPAYVRADADLKQAAAGIADGALFNSGQSCCSIERIYVDRRIMSQFLGHLSDEVAGLNLGNPLEAKTSLGPVVNSSAAEFVRAQVAEAVASGAKLLIDPGQFSLDKKTTPYLAPQIVTGVNHGMRLMTEESFGPVAGVMAVDSDAEAIELMNDSEFGLTASIWTEDAEAARSIGNELETGTVFMNRSDYLDPALAWAGVKNTGRGCTLSVVGFEQLTRPKSYHFKLN